MTSGANENQPLFISKCPPNVTLWRGSAPNITLWRGSALIHFSLIQPLTPAA